MRDIGRALGNERGESHGQTTHVRRSLLLPPQHLHSYNLQMTVDSCTPPKHQALGLGWAEVEVEQCHAGKSVPLRHSVDHMLEDMSK
jgi:hypothetical protein